MPPELTIAIVGGISAVLGGIVVKAAEWLFGRRARSVNGTVRLTGVAMTLVDQLQEEIGRLRGEIARLTEQIQIEKQLRRNDVTRLTARIEELERLNEGCGSPDRAIQAGS